MVTVQPHNETPGETPDETPGQTEDYSDEEEVDVF